MPWNELGVFEQRLRFVLRAGEGEPIRRLCREFGIAPNTAYKWLQRYREAGSEGLQDRSRRPKRSPNQTAPSVERRLVELRKQRPDWGAPKLAKLLDRDEGIMVKPLTAHRVLLRHGLVREEDRHRHAIQRFARDQPNELWQMDFKGVKKPHFQQIVPLTVLDDHSRYVVGLRALPNQQGETVREALEEVFQEAGVPVAALMDHGTPWWDMQGQGWTWLTVWLMKQGIRLYFSGYRHPQTQGKVERFHGALERAMVYRGRPQKLDDWAPWLEQFREEYNQVRPHEELNMDTPAEHWDPSSRSYDPSPPEWDYGAGAEVRQLGTLGQVFLGEDRWVVSRALAKERVKLERMGQLILVYYRRTLVRIFNLETGIAEPVTVAINTRSLFGERDSPTIEGEGRSSPCQS